jgi:hypothetical protein
MNIKSNWEQVNLYEWMELQKVFTSTELNELDQAVKSLSILSGVTEREIDNLSVSDLNKYIKKLDWLEKVPKPEPADFIDVNGKRYRCIYNINKMPFARYIEAKHFSTDIMGNLHNILACMVIPMRKNWYGKWVLDKYNSEKHSEYAQDMLEANFLNVYGSIGFFLPVYKTLISSLKDYLKENLIQEGMNKEVAEEFLLFLCRGLDGFITRNLSGTITV